MQPASYDLSLADEVLVPNRDHLGTGTVDLRRTFNPSLLQRLKISGSDYVLFPGECLLASTVETLRVPNDLVARVEGKSSIGRLFLTAHVTAGFIDSGFVGQVTLEICNLGPWRVLLRPGMKIAQVNFTKLTQPCARPYGSSGLGSHYQGQQGPTAAR